VTAKPGRPSSAPYIAPVTPEQKVA